MLLAEMRDSFRRREQANEADIAGAAGFQQVCRRASGVPKIAKAIGELAEVQLQDRLVYLEQPPIAAIVKSA